MDFNIKNISELKINKLSKKIIRPIFCAGPCAVESYESLYKISKDLKEKGANLIRAGAFKPRTSPYDFQGLGLEGLNIIKSIKKELNIEFVSELTDLRYLDAFLDTINYIQVGSRNMYNTPLLKELGKTNKTIVLKRGIAATYKEWLFAAEYIALEGNTNIIMCERGIRTFNNFYRNTLDIAAVPYIKQYLPIIVDLSHSLGHPSYVKELALASFAAGADGIMLEVHNEPSKALCDAGQAVDLTYFTDIINKALKLITFINTNV